MASPILISSSSAKINSRIASKAFEFALLGGLRSFHIVNYYDVENHKIAVKGVALSILVQLFFWICVYLVQGSVFITNWLFGTNLIARFEYFRDILNLSFILTRAGRYFDSTLDSIFIGSLKDVKKYSGDVFYKNMYELTDPPEIGRGYRLPYVGLHCIDPDGFQIFLRTSVRYIIKNLALHFILTKSYRVGYLLFAFFFFRNINDAVGTFPAIIIVSASHLLPSYYLLIILNYINGSEELVRDTLAPYFSRIKLTNFERTQWIRSRNGVFMVFGLFYFFLLYQLPSISYLIFAVAQSSMAYLVANITDCPPKQSKQLILWASSQLVWNPENF